MTETYGGAFVGMCYSSTKKFGIDELNFVYWSNKNPMESGVWFGPGWTCNISLIDSAVMVKSMVWLGTSLFFDWGCSFYGNNGQFLEICVPQEIDTWEN